MAIDNHYDGEVIDWATKFQKREIAVSTQSSPTNKSKDHLEAVYRETQRQFYNELDREVYQEVDHDSTEAAYPEHNNEVDQMVTDADFQRRIPSQCHLPMNTGCTIYSTEHAEALHGAQTVIAHLNLPSLTMYREAHLLDVNKWDEPVQLTYTIDGYDRYRQRKPRSVLSHEQKLYHPDDYNKDLCRRDTSYECGIGWQVECCMNLGVQIQRNWGLRLGSGGNGSIEFRNSGLEEVINCVFHSSVSSLLFSILSYFFGSQPGINGIGTGFTTCGSQSMGGGVSPFAGSAERLPYCAKQ